MAKDTGMKPIKSHLKARDKGVCKKHNIPKRQVKFNNVWREAWCTLCTEEQAKRDAEKRQKEHQQQIINSLIANSTLSPRFIEKTFENYIASNDGQKTALRKAKEFVENFGKVETTGLIFIGSPGTGKGHLSCAIVNELIKTKRVTALVTTIARLVRALNATWDKNSPIREQELLDKLRSLDILAVDEIGVQYGSPTEKMRMTEIINDRYEHLKPTILIGNLTMPEMEKAIGERARDRFREGGTVVVFNWDSHRRQKK